MTDLLTETNPFATCRVRPGVIPFFFPPGQNARQLIDRLLENGWWGQIVGRHGSGKSTLLATLLPELRRVGQRPVPFQLHDGERRLPNGWRRDIQGGDPVVLIVDGYEMVSLWHRFWIERHCRRRGAGLLVTAHETMRLPDLYQTLATPKTTRRVVGHLLKDQTHSDCPLDVVTRLEAHGGNLREVLFELYDAFESTRRLTSTPADHTSRIDPSSSIKSYRTTKS